MNEGWKSWEGKVVNEEFPLQSYLGDTDQSGVFLTQIGSGAQKAAIKLVRVRAENSEAQIARWEVAAQLHHAGLLRVLGMGRCELGGHQLLYVLSEYAEEDLGQIIPQRALTVEEAEAVLKAVVDTLRFVHGKGFVHGRVKPQNILAVGDQVKLSSDSLRAAGEPELYAPGPAPQEGPEAGYGLVSAASDVWALGVTLVQVLARRVPIWHRGSSDEPTFPELPAPFGEVVRHCLQIKPEQRWTVAEIAARLEGKAPEVKQAAVAIPVPAIAEVEVRTPSVVVPATPTPMAKWMYLAPIGVIAVGGMIWAGSKLLGSHGTGTDAPGAQTAQSSEEAAKPAVSAGEAAQSEAAVGAGQSDSGKLVVVHQVVPELSRSAQRSIHGTIRVTVKVEVDAAGNVTRAKLESGRASQYFVRQAMDAAREWKFAPAGSTAGTRSCVLRFGFSRKKIEASVGSGRR